MKFAAIFRATNSAVYIHRNNRYPIRRTRADRIYLSNRQFPSTIVKRISELLFLISVRKTVLFEKLHLIVIQYIQYCNTVCKSIAIINEFKPRISRRFRSRVVIGGYSGIRGDSRLSYLSLIGASHVRWTKYWTEYGRRSNLKGTRGILQLVFVFSRFALARFFPGPSTGETSGASVYAAHTRTGTCN